MNLSTYYAQISKIPHLTKEEEVALFAEYYAENTTDKRKAQIKDKVITSNLCFVFKAAKGYCRNEPSMFQELIAAGNDGLCVGFEKYKPESGVKYLTYAGHWVKQRILDQMAGMRIVHLPKQKQQLSTKIQRLRDKNENMTVQDVKNLLPDQSEKSIEELYQTRFLTLYISDLDSESDAFSINPIEEEVQKNMDNEKTWKTVASLPSPHREIVAKLFGLEDGEETSIAQLSKTLKMPKNDIKRIRDEALEMLKGKFQTQFQMVRE